MEHKMNVQGKPGSETLSPAGPQGTERTRQPAGEEWRAEFPYPWSEDEVVTRRDTLRFLQAGYGALFLSLNWRCRMGSFTPSRWCRDEGERRNWRHEAASRPTSPERQP